MCVIESLLQIGCCEQIVWPLVIGWSGIIRAISSRSPLVHAIESIYVIIIAGVSIQRLGGAHDGGFAIPLFCCCHFLREHTACLFDVFLFYCSFAWNVMWGRLYYNVCTETFSGFYGYYYHHLFVIFFSLVWTEHFWQYLDECSINKYGILKCTIFIRHELR